MLYNTFSSSLCVFFLWALSCKSVVLQIQTVVNMGFRIVLWTDEAHFKKKLINIPVCEQDANTFQKSKCFFLYDYFYIDWVCFFQVVVVVVIVVVVVVIVVSCFLIQKPLFVTLLNPSVILENYFSWSSLKSFSNKDYLTTQSAGWLGYEWSHCALWLCFSELHLWREHRRRRKRDEDVDSKRQVYRPSGMRTHDQLSGILCRSWGNLC